MTAEGLADALLRRGLDPEDRIPTRQLFDRALAAAGGLAPGAPWQAWWIPGRLEVFGKHTDYGGGRTLVCAVPRGLALVARRREDEAIVVADAQSGESVTLSAARPDATFDGWRHYAEVTARRLAKNFPGAIGGADIVFAGNLPRASGMSSSSALVVASAAALARLNDLPERPEWRMNIHDDLETASYYACIENGRTFGALAGDAGVGTHGGSEDHAAILTAQSGQLSAFAFVPMRALGRVPLPETWRFVIGPSTVKSEKTGGSQAPYNRLAEAVRVLLEAWNAHERRAHSLAAALESDASAVERLRRYVQQVRDPEWPAIALERRLDHFVREDARVVEALRAFRSADAERLGALAAASQDDAETLLENQVEETIALARDARAHGAFAACSFGAGFGGSVWALTDARTAAAFAARWHPDAFVMKPGPPLSELGVIA